MSNNIREIIEKYRDTFASGHDRSITFEESAEIFDALVKLEKRWAKIAKISDGYQAELHELKNKFAEFARTDYLTGLPNRRDIHEKMSAEQSRCQRTGKTFSLIMADLDHFKKINDAHGHVVGDEVLTAVTVLLKGSLREEDCCARWGGEEFLILLPETEMENALIAAERLRQRVENYPLVRAANPIRMTMSFGVAAYRLGDHIADCISRADQALYRAKNAGRNRIAVPGDSVTPSDSLPSLQVSLENP